jgi:hypothetical protein
MKVYIGGYGHRFTAFGIQDWLMEKRHTKEVWWSLEPENYDKWDTLIEKTVLGLQWILDKTINKITDGERKVKVRIDYYDTWSMDHTLALIIHPMLLQLKEKNHGYFHSDPEDAPHIGQDEGADFTNDAKAEDRYNWIMDEMIWTFEHIKNDDSYELFYTEEKGWDREAMNAHEERIKNGLRLFGKYFRGLWD